MLYDPLLNWTTQQQCSNNSTSTQQQQITKTTQACPTTRMRVPRHSARAWRSSRLRIWKKCDSFSRYIFWRPMLASFLVVGGAPAAAESARRALRLGLSWVAADLDEGGSSYRAKMSRGWAAAKAEWGPTLWATPPRFHRCDSHSGFHTAALSPTFSVCRCHTHGHTDTHTVTHTQTHNINSTIFVLPLRLIYHWHVFDFNIIYVCMCAAVLFVYQSVKNNLNEKDSLWPCLFFYLSVPTAYIVCILKKYYSAMWYYNYNSVIVPQWHSVKTLLNTHVIKDCWFCIAFTV